MKSSLSMPTDNPHLPASHRSPVTARVLLAALLLAGFGLHLLYIMWNCPLDLSGDEAQYWEWSRHLDLAYYSKGPLVAYVIRASCAVFGDLAWAVRLPALVLGVGTSLCTYWLTTKLFKSERLALGVVAITHTLPVFALGSMLMTIDPPFYFCWALATCFAAKAVIDNARWAWAGVGIAIGFGLLAKYAAPLWFVGLFAFLIADRDSRKWLRSVWPYLAVLIAVAFFSVPLAWNMQNDWVTARHVGRQLGLTQSEGSWIKNPPVMLVTQFGVLTPIFATFVVLAAVDVLRGRCGRSESFLLSIGGAFFTLCFLQSSTTEIEPNWPVPAYFTLIILGTSWIAARMRNAAEWKRLRGFFWAHVVIGSMLVLLVHRTDLIYPLLKQANVAPRRFDAQLVKMRGNAELGRFVSELRSQMPRPGQTFLLTRAYQDAALLAFYVEGQPGAFHVGSYLRGMNSNGVPNRTRYSQWDLWPDRDLAPQRSPVIGHDAIFVGGLDNVGTIRNAFERVDIEPAVVRIERHGLFVREFTVFRCYGFKGVERPQSEGRAF
jgi:4-amino-4-deoxy-L-arabinose transferase-like glycosyltransferase